MSDNALKCNAMQCNAMSQMQYNWIKDSLRGRELLCVGNRLVDQHTACAALDVQQPTESDNGPNSLKHLSAFKSKKGENTKHEENIQVWRSIMAWGHFHSCQCLSGFNHCKDTCNKYIYGFYFHQIKVMKLITWDENTKVLKLIT